MKRLTLQVAFCVAAAALSLSAGTITASLPQFDGPLNFAGFPDAPVTIGTFHYVIPSDQHIVGATFTSSWGNSNFPDSAPVDLYVGGILVGSCQILATCDTGFSITPFSFTFLPSSFQNLSSGSLTVTAVQNGPIALKIGAETLTLTTSNTPEPASIGLFGLGAAALGLLKVRRTRNA